MSPTLDLAKYGAPPSPGKLGKMNRLQLETALAAWRARQGEFPPESWDYEGPLIAMLARKVELQAAEGSRRWREGPGRTR